MCKSRAEGGQRCAAHTRPRYEVAYGALRAARRPDLSLVVELEQAAADYASTAEGFARIGEDVEAEERRGAWEQAALLRTAMQQGQSRREASEAFTAAVAASGASAGSTASSPASSPEAGPVPAAEHDTQAAEQSAARSDGTPPEPLQWSPTDPIWPKRQVVNDAIAGARVKDPDLLRRAYRSLFRDAWRAKFFQKGSHPVGPASNDEGWTWRRETTDQATAAVRGAHDVTVKDLAPGMTVYNGFGVRTVARATSRGTANLMRPGASRTARVETFSVRYADGRTDKVLAADDVFVRLPALEAAPEPDRPGS